MEALGWTIAVLGWIFGIVGIFCLIVTIIALFYPVIVMGEELLLHHKSTFLLFDINNPDKIHFFVDMPNEVVIPVVELGHNLREFLINSDHKDFSGQGTNKERWKIVEKSKAFPFQYLSNVEGWYRGYIHNTTGRMYIGFYPFRKVDTKEITKKVRSVSDKGWFENVKSVSNHLRIRPFEWNFEALNADVAGLIPVNVYGVLLFECVNPYESWRGIDAWDSQLTNAPVSAVRDILKNWSVEDIIASNVKEESKTTDVAAKRLEVDLIEKLQREYEGEIFGFKIVRVQIFDVEPVLTPQELEKARAGFFAGREGEAYKIKQRARGEADAGYLQTMSAQLSADSENGRFITEQDTRRQMAQGGKATIIFDNGGSTPPLEKKLMLVADRLEKSNETPKEGESKEKPSK